MLATAEFGEGSLDDSLTYGRPRCTVKLTLAGHFHHLLGVAKSLQDGKPTFADDLRQVVQHLIEIRSILQHKPDVRAVVDIGPNHALESFLMKTHRRTEAFRGACEWPEPWLTQHLVELLDERVAFPIVRSIMGLTVPLALGWLSPVNRCRQAVR